MWYSEFGASFWITLAGILTASVGLCVRYSLKSKCDLVKICCGLIEIHRNVELETNDLEITSNDENKI
jgi:hypothetical protein